MSESQIQQPDATLKTLFQEILQIKKDIQNLNDQMVTQFAFLQSPLEEITKIAKEIRDTVEDKSQEEEEDTKSKTDPYGFGIFDGQTPRARDKGKEKMEQTPKPGMGLASSLTGCLGAIGEPQAIFGNTRTCFSQPPPSSAHTPTRGRSPTKEHSPTRQTSPAKDKKKCRVKLDPLTKLKSIIPKDIKKWILDVTVWAQYYEDEFESEEEIVLHLFTLLKGELAYWASPFMGKLLSRPLTAPIQTLEGLFRTLIEAYGDPDAERATARKIMELNQIRTTVEYTTKFQTIAADLNWNELALMGQYQRGLHWKVQEVLSQRDNPPTTLQGIISAAQQIDAIHRENEESRPKKEKTKEKGKTTTQGTGSATKEKVADKENFVDRDKRDHCHKEGLCIKCSESGHSIKDCPNGQHKSKLKKDDQKEPKKESAKVAQEKPEEIEVEAKSGKE